MMGATHDIPELAGFNEQERAQLWKEAERRSGVSVRLWRDVVVICGVVLQLVADGHGGILLFADAPMPRGGVWLVGGVVLALALDLCWLRPAQRRRVRAKLPEVLEHADEYAHRSPLLGRRLPPGTFGVRIQDRDER